MKPTLLVFITAALFAQNWQPNVSNAKFESRAYAGNLGSQFRSDTPAWFGYAVKTFPGDHQNCCWSGAGPCLCQLEGERHNQVTGSRSSGPVQLEAQDALAVLFRVDGNEVRKVQAYSLSCPLDAGGRPFIWLTQVPSKDSLAYLRQFVTASNADHKLDGAVMAIALHDDPEADSILHELTGPGQSEKVREKAVFWLGAGRGDRGTAFLKELLAKDPSEHIRDKAVFALSISKDPKALDYIIEAAKTDSSPHIRGQALFWLAQKAGARSVAAISNAILNDPDTGVKEKAVFALSQLPKDEGVPKLIEVARDQRNPEVRKKAFFWLGQSRDPRALAFIEEVLTK